MKTDRLSSYNPLRGLDLPGLVHILEQGERGYYADLAWLYRYILKRNGSARAVRRKLTSAIGKLDWNIKIPDKLEGERKALAEEQQAELRQAFDRLDQFRETLRHLAFADIMGFAHCEKIYAGTAPQPWEIVKLGVVPQWHLCRDGLFAPWHYNPEASQTNRGTPIPAQHWIIREVEDPAAEIFAFAHLKMMTTDADWDQFCDTYAVPPLFIEQPPNIPKGQESQYQTTAEGVVSDGRGSLPHGSKVHTVTPGTGGESVFTERLRYYREEIVIAGTGGILNTLDGNTGIGKGPADNHEDAWLDIAAEIGMSISETLQDQFAMPILSRRFPGQEILAYFELDKPEPSREGASVLADAKAAREAGYNIDPAELSEKSGYTLSADSSTPNEADQRGGAPGDPSPAPQEAPTPGSAEPPQVSSPAAAARSTPIAGAIADDLGIEEQWLAPAIPLLAEVEAALADETTPLELVQEKLQAAIDRLPELLGQLDIDALADLLARDASRGTLAGLSDTLNRKRTPRA